jgi:hypothetical protein
LAALADIILLAVWVLFKIATAIENVEAGFANLKGTVEAARK